MMFRWGRLVSVCALLVWAAGCGDILEPERRANRRVQTESGLELLWRTPYTGTPWYSGTPAVEGERLFTGMGNAVVALDVRTGTRIWGTPIRGNLALGGDNIVARDGAVFLADVDAVFSFDAASGAVRWRSVPDSPAYQASSAVDERALYVGTRNHRVYALNKESGQLIWSVDIGPDWGITAFPNIGVITGLFVAEGRVFATADRGIEGVPYRRVGVIVALDRATGQEIWRYVSNDDYAPIYGALTVIGNLVIAGESSRNSFFALDASTGREVWRFHGQRGWGMDHPPVVRGDTVYMGSDDHHVYAADLRSGRILWKTTTGNASVTHLIACGDLLIGKNLPLLIFDRAAGRFFGAFALEDGPVSSSPISSGNTLFVMADRVACAYRCPSK